MADSPALRARRARRHRAGDHSLCDPARRCEARQHAETRDAATAAAALSDEGYGPRGAEFRAACRDAKVGALHQPLVDEAARMIDRLDRLHAALERRGEWLRVERLDDPSIVVIQIDSVLAEARQQAAVLKALVGEVRAALPKTSGRPGRSGGGATRSTGGVSDLSARIAARRGSPAG